MKKVKELKLTVSDGVYRKLKQSINIRGMAGNLYGIADGVLVKIIESLDKNEKELVLSLKKEGRIL